MDKYTRRMKGRAWKADEKYAFEKAAGKKAPLLLTRENALKQLRKDLQEHEHKMNESLYNQSAENKARLIEKNGEKVARIRRAINVLQRTLPETIIKGERIPRKIIWTKEQKSQYGRVLGIPPASLTTKKALMRIRENIAVEENLLKEMSEHGSSIAEGPRAKIKVLQDLEKQLKREY